MRSRISVPRMDPLLGDGGALVAAYRRLLGDLSAKLEAIPPEEVSMPTDPTLVQISRNMTEEFPDADPDAIQALAKSARTLGRAIVRLCPEGRERSLAITNAEQAFMWARTSIAQNGAAAPAATASRAAGKRGGATRTRAAAGKRAAGTTGRSAAGTRASSATRRRTTKA